MKKKYIFLSALFISAVLTGCSHHAEKEPGEYAGSDSAMGNDAETPEDNSAGDSETLTSEPADDRDASQAQQQEEAISGASEDVDDETISEEVEGNGSFFVKKGSNIYFHKYESTAFEKYAYDGDFLGYTGDTDKDTTLCLYNEETSEAKELTKDGCTGKLYLCGDKFYCEKQEGGYPEIWTIDLDGSKAELFAPGFIRGISDDGRLIALQMFAGDDLIYRIYDDAGNLSYDGPDDRDARVFYCGFSGDKLIYGKAKDEEALLYCADKSGSALIGTIPGMSGFGGPECDQFIEADDRFFCTFGYYGGPVDTIEDYYVVEGTTNEGSLRTVLHGYDEKVMPRVRENAEPFIRFTGGFLEYDPYLANSVYMDHSSGLKKHYSEVKFRYGDLYYYGKDGSSLKLAGSFIKLADTRRLFLQTAQVLGDSAYMMVGRGTPLPESDYNVYKAFAFEDMYYIRMPIKEDSKVQSIVGPDWNEAEILDMGDVILGEGIPLNVYWEDMRYYLEGDWELIGDSEGEKSGDTLKMSFAENGMASFKKGDAEGIAMFSYIISDLFDEPLYLSNRLDLVGVRISENFTDKASMLMGSTSSFQLMLANDRGSDILLLREIGKEDDVFSDEVLGKTGRTEGFWIFKRTGTDAPNRLKSSYSHDEMLRLPDHSFTAFMISDSGSSCTLMPMELSLVAENDSYIAYRPLDKGYGLSSVEYKYADEKEDDHEFAYTPGLVNVTTDDNCKVIEIKKLTYAENGYYCLGR